MPPFRFEQLSGISGRIYDRGIPVAEILDLHLCNARCSPGGEPLFGVEVPMPLYWQQYANHEDPARNASSRGELRCLHASREKISFACSGTNAAGELASLYHVNISYRADRDAYLYTVQAQLKVLPGMTWHITENPNHGEVEFANVYPARTFPVNPATPKRYQTCCVQRSAGALLIPHHHLESPDKQNIRMEKGDRFLWLLEDENPVLELASPTIVHAGLCAYMWDAHFGYRVCSPQPYVDLPEGSMFDATFLLTGMSRSAALAAVEKAIPPDKETMQVAPIYVEGVNTFRDSLGSSGVDPNTAWPWSTESDQRESGEVTFLWDRTTGYDDSASLCVRSSAAARGRWTATSLGPAFGLRPFRDGVSYTLSAYVRSIDLAGVTRVALRLHRLGASGLFDLRSYEMYRSAEIRAGSAGWTRLVVHTPPISPPPDRLHILLEQEGRGTTWFDNVLLEEDDTKTG